MDLYDLSREIKSFLGQDRRDVGDLIHKERASLVLVDGLGWNIAKDLKVSVNPEKRTRSSHNRLRRSLP